MPRSASSWVSLAPVIACLLLVARAESDTARYEELDSLAAAIGHLGRVPTGASLLVLSASAGWPGRVGDVVAGYPEDSPIPAPSGTDLCYGRWKGPEGRTVTVTAPLPGCVPRGLPLSTLPGDRASFRLEGLDTLRGAAVALSSPGMRVDVLRPDSSSRFSLFTPTEGVYWLEVMAEGGRGPEVTILLPVICGASPEDAIEGNLAMGESEAVSREEILSELNSIRISQGLRPLRQDGGLQAVARGRAVELAMNGGVEHYSDSGGSVRELLPDGTGFVAENIGRGSGYSEAWSMILISPFHLLSCLAPSATEIGMGASVQIEPDSWQMVLVQVLTTGTSASGGNR
ncbi:hypothetical protein GF402_02500 [Candidatus Fermentibacteria bacterium]|nr:hypothetical protein [Candidatus Fermentibacteria bacterium]